MIHVRWVNINITRRWRRKQERQKTLRKRTSENENGDLAVAENAQLHGLLHQACRTKENQMIMLVRKQCTKSAKSWDTMTKMRAEALPRGRTDTTLVECHRTRFQIVDSMNQNLLAAICTYRFNACLHERGQYEFEQGNPCWSFQLWGPKTHVDSGDRHPSPRREQEATCAWPCVLNARQMQPQALRALK